jgi:hypothetical protein
MSNRSAISRFHSDASLNLKKTFENSLVIIDYAGLSRVRIEATLKYHMPQHRWVARFYDDSRYLIEAPNQRWLHQLTSQEGSNDG